MNQKKWATPESVTALDMTFGGRTNELLPPMEDVPDEFFKSTNPWAEWQSQWFFSGLDASEIPKPKPGIDGQVAIRHLAAIQRSFEPKHEHKSAGVAYLASLWFKSPPLVNTKDRS